MTEKITWPKEPKIEIIQKTNDNHVLVNGVRTFHVLENLTIGMFCGSYEDQTFIGQFINTYVYEKAMEMLKNLRTEQHVDQMAKVIYNTNTALYGNTHGTNFEELDDTQKMHLRELAKVTMNEAQKFEG